MHLESETKKEILQSAAYTLEHCKVRKKALKKPLNANTELHAALLEKKKVGERKQSQPRTLIRVPSSSTRNVSKTRFATRVIFYPYPREKNKQTNKQL